MGSVPVTPPVSAVPRERLDGAFPNPRQLLVLLGCYFSLQVFLRLAFSDSLDLDEADAVVLAQKFSWGYGSDPPLYTWLQIASFQAFGTSILALSVLKNLLLFSTCSFTFATARLITQKPAAGVAAALSVFYLPSIAWESQRDLTHSVLSTTLAVATLFCLLQLRESRRLRWYVAFGLSAGLGVISKFNYTLWLLGLLLAGFSLKEFRPALLNLRLLLSAGLAFLIFLPNGLWMLEHRELALLNSSKLQVPQSVSWFEIARTGLKNIVQSLVAFSAPLAVICLVLFYKRAPGGGGESAPKSPGPRLIFRAWVVIGLVLLLLVFCVRVTGYKERWFQPILAVLPIAAVALVQHRLDRVRLKCLAILTFGVMLCVSVVLPGRLFAAESLKREEPVTRPYARIAARLRPEIPDGSLLICDSRLLAGNLRLGMPGVTCITTELAVLFSAPSPHCFLLWDARTHDSPPPELRRWLNNDKLPATVAAAPRYISEVYKYHRTKQFRVGVIQLY